MTISNLFFLGASISALTWFTVSPKGSTSSSGEDIVLMEEEFMPRDSTKGKTTKKFTRKTTRPSYTPQDRYGDEFSNPASKTPLILGKPSNVKTEVTLDTNMKTYTIRETVGGVDYRPPTTMTFEEYQDYKNKNAMRNYWKNKTSGDKLVASKNKTSNALRLPVRGLNGPFGGDFVEIKPNGLVTLDFAGKWQKVNNPNIPIRQQRNGNFDFDQQISMNVVGKIGEKLKITSNWDTKATFDFQNNIKLEYTGFAEDIIQKIEAGTVSLPLNSTLIAGAQNLFGVKTKLQFGRFTITGILSSQRGKVEEMTIQGGAQNRDFEIKMDGYDLYRHFFLGHFFREKYEPALQSLPMVNSGVKITRMEVYITNRNNNTTTLRNMIAYLDLGENEPHDSLNLRHAIHGRTIDSTANASNKLYSKISGATFRDPITIDKALSDLYLPNQGMVRGTDYERIDQARKLLPSEYTYNADLGYLSLVTPLTALETIGIAFEYTYNGVAHKVGELNGDYNNITGDSLIILKLLKPAAVKNHLPTWDLMMKNIYQLPASQITKDNFQLRVIYKNDLSGADLPNLQEGEHAKNIPLVRLMGLDRLNPNNDPPGDGNFDYIEGITLDSKTGRIIFPVLEPLGSHLTDTTNKFGYIHPGQEPNLVTKYAFTELYDSTQSDAMQKASKDKYFLRGKYQTSNSKEIALPGINIAPGSVTVLAGSTPLVEGTDYTVNAEMGRITILNDGVLNSGREIKIRFEKQDLFNFRRKSFMGTRMEYKIGKNFLAGATFLHQQEAPQLTRVSIGDEPTNNSLWGADISYQKNSRFITRMVDKLPVIQTKALSSINFTGEFAQLLPGHAKVIDKSTNGTSFIDDFEGSETPFDFTRSPTKWRLSATPRRFAESTEDSLPCNFRRAKLAWYTIDNTFYDQTRRPKTIDDKAATNHYVRFVAQQELYPNRDRQIVNTNEPTLDLAYFPDERGPYNYSKNINAAGKLNNPSQNWGAMTREIRSDIDFDNANIQYIEFWMMDPYLQDAASDSLTTLPISGDYTLNKKVPLNNTGGLFFNLGSISEDVMKDKRHEFENGLPVSEDTSGGIVSKTPWGLVPNQPFITNAFDLSSGSREKQDVGLDGLKNNAENSFFANFRDFISSYPGMSTATKDSILRDISADDFKYFLSTEADNSNQSILQRYKNFNGMENNSPTESAGAYTPSNSSSPDNEDMNGDNTINDIDEYYEYKINIDPTKFIVGENNIVSKETSTINGDKVTWYQFRIPIRLPDSVVGGISDFKSIKFFRTYMTGFESPIVLRLAQFQLVSSQWRIYNNLDDLRDGSSSFGPGDPGNPSIVVSTINIEENGQGSTTNAPYVVPPGFNRDRDVGAQNNRRLNEQSLKICVNNLKDGYARAAYKNINLNLLNYGKLRMFLHAETAENIATYQDGSAHAFLRFGTDFIDNYYEIEVPLYFTNPRASTDENQIWRSENEIEVAMKDLVAVKMMRNNSGIDPRNEYITTYQGRIIRVKGNPDQSAVQGIMMGIRNPKDADKGIKSVCIWADELRMTDFVEKSGWATASKLNVKLADLGTLNASLRYVTPGFGAIDQKVSQRANNYTTEWGISSNLALDKFIPAKLGIRLPMYISYDVTSIAPKYNPLDPDVLLKTSLEAKTPEDRKAYRKFTIDETRRRSLNFTNIQKVKTKKGAKSHIYDIENLSLTTAYSETQRHNINLKDYNQKYYKGSIGYAYNSSPKNYEPLKKISWLKSPYLKFIRDFNFTLLPSSLTFRTDVDRKLTRTQYFEGKPLEGGVQDALFEKSFIFTRSYGLLWNFTKSVSLDYSSTASGVIDEPSRDPSIDKKQYKDSIMHNLKALGRVKNFDQTIGLNYKLPLDKLPFTDWISADTRYAANYKWTSGALFIRDTIGNTIQNSRDMKLTGKINMEKLYNKLKFLNNINNPPPTKPKAGPNAKKDTSQTLPKPELKGLKVFLKSMMTIRSINFNYNLTQGLLLAGYLPKANYFGVDKHQSASDILPFILGSQNTDMRYRAAENNNISESRSLNTPFTRTRNVTYSAQTTLEPIKDFKIQVDAQKATTSSYSELFRIDPAHLIDPTNHNYVSESPTSNGTVTMSFISIATAFKHSHKNSTDPNASSTFTQMETNREIIRKRLNNSQNYSLNSQEVLIPAFLAAYSGKDPEKQKLSPFPSLPLPNWNINYTGLTRIKKLAKIFPSFAVTHVYTCTYNVNYRSSLSYGSDVIKAGEDPTVSMPQPTVIDSGVYKPIYVIDQLSILEKFAPFLGINFRTKGKLTGRLDYTRSRSLTMNMSNASMTEIRTNGLVFGVGITKSGFKIPFSGRNPIVLKNELQIRMDVTVNDTKTVLRTIDQISTVTAGNLNFQLKPTINYMVNTRVTIQFYFDRQINAPKISSSYRRATTAFGLQIRFTLS